jgi:hypothetical protein
MEPIGVVDIIKREMKNRRITAAEVARALQVNPSSVKGMLQRPTLQVQKLAELSVFFRYNFFYEIAEKLSFSAPDFLAEQHSGEAISLQKRVAELEQEVKILRQTIKDLAGR